MPDNKPTKLSDIIDPYAPQGTNDRRWFEFEHHLIQAAMSTADAFLTLMEIVDTPENDHEKLLALDCASLARRLHTVTLGKHAAILAYLSKTEIPEKISRKEL
jgi:hypothetical protein